jgi:hypothetical protein
VVQQPNCSHCCPSGRRAGPVGTRATRVGFIPPPCSVEFSWWWHKKPWPPREYFGGQGRCGDVVWLRPPAASCGNRNDQSPAKQPACRSNATAVPASPAAPQDYANFRDGKGLRYALCEASRRSAGMRCPIWCRECLEVRQFGEAEMLRTRRLVRLGEPIANLLHAPAIHAKIGIPDPR